MKIEKNNLENTSIEISHISLGNSSTDMVDIYLFEKPSIN
jgi:hypothetical protein